MHRELLAMVDSACVRRASKNPDFLLSGIKVNHRTAQMSKFRRIFSVR